MYLTFNFNFNFTLIGTRYFAIPDSVSGNSVQRLIIALESSNGYQLFDCR